MLPDTRVILRHHPYEVHAERHEVMWRDGSSVVLHPVFAHGMPMLLLRALALEPGRLRLFDLSALHRPFDASLRHTHQRDVAGFVFFTLRAEYLTAAAFSAHVARHCMGTWSDAGDGTSTWTPRRDASGQAALLDVSAPGYPRGPMSEAVAA